MPKETTIQVKLDVDNAPLEQLQDQLKTIENTGSTVGEGISESLKEVSDSAEETSNDVMEMVQTLEDGTQITYTGVSQSLDEAASSADNVSTSICMIDGSNIDEAATSADTLSGALGGIDGSGLDDAASSAAGLKDELDGAAESAGGLSEESKTFEESTMQWATVSTTVGQISQKVGSLNGSFVGLNETVGMVSANTGYSANQVRELASSYTTVGTSASDAAIYLQRFQNAGLEPSSAGMDQAMANAHKLQTAFRLTGAETDSLMGSLKRAGIDANQLGESFNALGYISSETNISIGTFQSVLTTSGANMEKYGVSVDVAAVALSKINGRYRTARQAGSAFNKAVEESGGDISKLEQELGLTAGTLQNASAETSKASSTVDNLSQSYEDAQGPIGQLNSALDAFTMQISGVLGPISNFSATLSSIFSGAADIRASIGMAKDAFSSLKDKISNLKEAGNGSIFAGINSKFDGLRAKLDSVKVAAGKLKTKLSTIGSGGSGALATFKGKLNTLKTALMSVKTKAMELGTKLLDVGKKALIAGANALKSVAMWVASGVAQAGAAIKAWLLAAAEWAAASPILILIIVIGALIAILVYLYFNSEQVRNAINWLGEQLMSVAQLIWDSIINALTWLSSLFMNLYNSIVNFVTMAVQMFQQFAMMAITSFLSFITFLASLPVRVWNFLLQVILRVASWAVNIGQKALSAGRDLVSKFISGITSLPGKVATELDKTLSKVKDWGVRILQKFGNIAVEACKAFLAGLGINSPGYIQIKTIRELWNTARRIPESLPTMVHNLKYYAKSMVDAYGEPELEPPTMKKGLLSNLPATSDLLTGTTSMSVDNKSLLNNKDNKPQGIVNNNVTIEVGSVDNEKRVQEIVDAVTRVLHWDNKTAGRTV